MKTQKKTAGSDDRPGDVLYNAIMRQIEPDLMTTQLPLLEEKYKGESESEYNGRMDRYEKALKEFDEIMESLKKVSFGEMRKRRAEVKQKMRRKEGREKSEEIKKAEEGISRFDLRS